MIGCDSPVIACGDMVYFGANARKKSDATVKVLNTKTNEIKSTRVRYGPDLHIAKSVPIKNNDVYELATCGSYVSSYANYQNNLNWNGVFRSRNDYLATINNLDTPVTKTSDKTMRITYVLQGE